MTVEEIFAEVERLRGMVGDPEIAHSNEDRLRRLVLEAIAAGADDPAGLAAAALRTGEIEFSRWYA